MFSHNNLRLLSRQSDAYHVGPSRMWDVGGYGVESFTGVGMLEGADLSLDEQALEEIIDSLTWVSLSIKLQPSAQELILFMFLHHLCNALLNC